MSPSPHSRHGLAGALAALATLAAMIMEFAAPASATPPADPPSTSITQCLGTEAITYTPGLTLTSQQVALDASGTLGPCVTTAGTHFSGGQITFSGSGSLSCSIGGSSAGSAHIVWSGGETSVFAYRGAVSLRPGGVTVLVLTGTVTSGAFTGEKVLSTITLASTDLVACLTPQGLTSTSGPITLDINPLI
ncbi:hypothetical protein [Streptomyces sp. NPDC001665]